MERKEGFYWVKVSAVVSGPAIGVEDTILYWNGKDWMAGKYGNTCFTRCVVEVDEEPITRRNPMFSDYDREACEKISNSLGIPVGMLLEKYEVDEEVLERYKSLSKEAANMRESGENLYMQFLINNVFSQTKNNYGS